MFEYGNRHSEADLLHVPHRTLTTHLFACGLHIICLSQLQVTSGATEKSAVPTGGQSSGNYFRPLKVWCHAP